MRKVLSLTQEESLRARDRGTISHIPPVLTIPIPHLLPKERRHWHFLQSKERLPRIFHEPPLIAYRRPESLQDTLVSAKMRTKTPGVGTTTGADLVFFAN